MSANVDRSSSWRTSTLHCRPCQRSGGGGGDPATWSQYPATQDVGIGCHRIVDVSGINFCDGSYVGHGDSFDITSGEKIVIKSTDNTEIQRYNAAGSVMETSMRVKGQGAVEIATPDITQGFELESYDFGYFATTIRGKGAPLEIAQSSGLQGSSSLRFDTDTGGSGVTLKSSTNVTIQGEISTISSGGNININAGSSLIIDATNTILKNTITSEPVLKFENPSSPNLATATLTYGTTNNYNGNGSSLLLEGLEMGITEGGAGVGSVRIGTTSTENYVYGGGLPLLIKNSYNNLTAIRMDSLSMFAGIENGSNPEMGLIIDSTGITPRAELVIDSQISSVGLRYDTTIGESQFHFNSNTLTNDFISTSSGNLNGMYLRIFVNGSEYKIALHSP